LLINRLPHSYNLLDDSVDNIKTILAQPGFRQDKRASLACSRQKRIAQYKFEMMALTIETMETLIRSHGQTANEEMNVTWLSRTSADSSSQKRLLDIIKQRQILIINRTEQNIKYKLSFFDHAPAAANMNETAGH
jgi:hypothetical protein